MEEIIRKGTRDILFRIDQATWLKNVARAVLVLLESVPPGMPTAENLSDVFHEKIANCSRIQVSEYDYYSRLYFQNSNGDTFHLGQTSRIESWDDVKQSAQYTLQNDARPELYKQLADLPEFVASCEEIKKKIADSREHNREQIERVGHYYSFLYST